MHRLVTFPLFGLFCFFLIEPRWIGSFTGREFSGKQSPRVLETLNTPSRGSQTILLEQEPPLSHIPVQNDEVAENNRGAMGNGAVSAQGSPIRPLPPGPGQSTAPAHEDTRNLHKHILRRKGRSSKNQSQMYCLQTVLGQGHPG